MFHVKLDNQVKSGTLLVVDDQQINRLIAKEVLMELGFNVVLAKNGLEALDILEQSPVDLVLMDLYMPIMDGIETTVHIRASEKFKQLPIVALTADMNHEQLIHCLNAGMNDVIAKPLQPDVITSVVSRLLPASPLADVQRAAGESHWPGAPGLDIPLALERLNGKTDLYFKMLDKYREQYADSAIALSWLIDTGDIKGAIRLLHSISGASAHLAALNIQKQAAALETSLREDPARQLQLKSFELSIQEVMETIDHILLANG